MENFPFKENQFYDHKTIYQKLNLGFSGGIRASSKNKKVVLFWNAPSENPQKDREDKFGRVNIYRDFYDSSTGLYHYIGEGQKGDQTLEGGAQGNKKIAEAKKMGRTIHLFRQHVIDGLHQYLGQVELYDIKKQKQPDIDGKDREVFVFQLRPVSNNSNPQPELSDDEIVSRESESIQSKTKSVQMSNEEIANKILELNSKIKKMEPKMKTPSRDKSGYQRFKGIVELLKEYHKKCMICGQAHFEKENGALYSEVSHIIPFFSSHKDNVENLMVLCPTCHKKFDNAKNTERRKMYEKLIANYPDIKFEKPSFMLE